MRLYLFVELIGRFYVFLRFDIHIKILSASNYKRICFKISFALKDYMELHLNLIQDINI